MPLLVVLCTCGCQVVLITLIRYSDVYQPTTSQAPANREVALSCITMLGQRERKEKRLVHKGVTSRAIG